MPCFLCCERSCGIFMQISVLVTLILYLLTKFIDINLKSSTTLLIFIITYIVYLIIEFSSPSLSF